MNSVTLIVTLILLLVIFGGGYIFWVQYKTKKSLVGKKLATILTAGGERQDKLLKVEGNQIWDEKGHRKRPIPYMIRPDKSFDVWWPLGKPKILQVSVKSFLYAEGNPEPIDPFNRPPVITNEVLGNLSDINFSRAMVGRTGEIVEGERAGKFKLPIIIYVAIGLALLASIVAIFLAFAGGS